MDGFIYTDNYGVEGVHFPSIEPKLLDEWDSIVVF